MALRAPQHGLQGGAVGWGTLVGPQQRVDGCCQAVAGLKGGGTGSRKGGLELWDVFGWPDVGAAVFWMLLLVECSAVVRSVDLWVGVE